MATPHDEAFLQAIRENPDDDAPRLIYADWLEERGDPRGEFIRVQCTLAGLAPDDPRRPQLQAREQTLLAEHRQEWLGGLREAAAQEPHGPEWQFQRGFVESIVIDARLFLERAEEIFAHAGSSA